MRDPVVVLGAARSGTSMTAGIFAKHGCWAGTCRPPDKYNAKGYFENQPLKQLLLDRYGYLKQKMEVSRPLRSLRAEIERAMRGDGYTEGPWVAKHGALYFEAWHEWDPVFVCVYRNPAHTLQSNKRDSFPITKESVMLCQGALEWVEQNHGGHRVDAGRVVAGDYSQLRPAFDEAGLEMDENIIDGFVDRDLWHHS